MTEILSSNRFVLEDEDWVYKLPTSERGQKANQQEYENYLKNPDIIAYTESYYWGLKQEKLFNIQIFPWEATEKDIPEELKPLWKQKLRNRFQVGQDKQGKWKFFDFEDVKFEEIFGK